MFDISFPCCMNKTVFFYAHWIEIEGTRLNYQLFVHLHPPRLMEWLLFLPWAFRYLLGAVHKRRQNFLGHFWYPPPPCWNFNPDLPNPYLQISCNFEIWDPPSPPPPKISDVFYGWPLARQSHNRLLQVPREVVGMKCISAGPHNISIHPQLQYLKYTGGPRILWFLVPKGYHEIGGSWIMGFFLV